ncbi:MAG: uracil phosphoribosyltransferase [Eubacterium sp.]|nr:uracil phosphoribosyltransferase [Eubacterium sp.]
MDSMIKILDHPLIQHKISLLRDKNTDCKDFRELVKEISMLIAYEATRDLPLSEVCMETPVAIAKTKIIAGRKMVFIPILRAGLGMVDGAVTLIPAAKVGHIGLCRSENKSKVTEYYCKLPYDVIERDVIVMDLMLATGVSAITAISKVKEIGARSIKFMCVVACPEGAKALREAHPDVAVFCGAMDDGLNDELYIVPGIGDGGDRIFGTK